MTDSLDRLKTVLADRYAIEREIGAGGMATVYLAEDLKHQRKVAVKVLRPELAAVLGAERFVQEIKTTANLQHPHILPLFDSGEADGFLYYVMPYIEGETLRDKLNRETQLGIDEAVQIATDVADALDYAHRHSVIHRDIKPENILLHDGRPMVADFGIALAVSAAAGGRMTETGLSLGTPHYMSPEQATADKNLTNRSDIYSLGCVLYEMLTGDPPHTGSSAQAIIMKIVTEDVQPVTRLRKSVPPHVAAATTKSLEKLPADRFASASKLAEALNNAAFALPTSPAGVPVGQRITSKERVLWIAVTMLAFVAAGLSWLARGSPSEMQRAVARFTINLPDTIPLAFIGSASLGNGRRALAISHDGKMLVYAGEQDGVNRLFIRPIDSYDVRVLPGTDGAYNPFFSPDGGWVGFFSGNEVKKIAVDGQAAVLLATIINPMGADWGIDDRILIGNEGGDLSSVSAEGGATEVLRERGLFLYPSILPGGDGVVVNDEGGARVVDLARDQDHVIRSFASGARYVGSGHLMWSRWSTLFAAPFDLDRWQVTGQGVPVVSGVRSEIYGVSQWDVSETGTLVYATGPAVAEGQLTWVGRGQAERLPFQDTPHGTFQLSPDEKRIAILVQGQSDDVWIYDIGTGRRERLTFGGVHNQPIWSPDGARVAFTRYEEGDVYTYVRSVDAGTEAQRLFPELQGGATSWSGDGRFVAVQNDSSGVVVVDLTESRIHQVAPRPAWGGVLSPDGRFIAYTSGASGEYQIFVEPFPSTDLRLQVSREGGSEEPVWSRDGTRLYYRSGQRIMVAPIATQPQLTVGTPSVAFRGDFVNVGMRSYDVASDGRLLVIDGGNGTTTRLNVVVNFFEELREKVGR